MFHDDSPASGRLTVPPLLFHLAFPIEPTQLTNTSVVCRIGVHAPQHLLLLVDLLSEPVASCHVPGILAGVLLH